jgi:hypothetical protein
VTAFDPAAFDSAAFDAEAAPTGVAVLPLRVIVGAFGVAALPLRVSVGGPGVTSLPLRILVGSPGTVALPLRVSVITPGVLDGTAPVSVNGTRAAAWGVIVVLNGVDVTASVTGEVTVEAEEGAARVADFALHQPPGTVINPSQLVGRAVRIDFCGLDTAGQPVNPLPLFTGIVDVPTVAPLSGVIALSCTDDLQGIVSGMSTAQIAALLAGSRWSPAVFDKGAPAWTHAQDRLSTLPSALDLSPLGQPRVTPWAALNTPNLIHDADDVLDESLAVEVAERSRLTNQVDIAFGYRFPRLKAEGYAVAYDYMALNNTSLGYWVKDGGAFLFRSAVEAAIQAAGGTIESVTWTPLPTTPVSIPGTDGYWLPSPATDPLMCLGFDAVVSFDFAQQTEEQHTLTVANAASIAAVGLVRESMSGALEGVYDDTVAVEQHVIAYKRELTTIPPKNFAPVEVGLTNSVTGTLTTDSDRAAADAAMETLIAVAMTKIRAAHRTHAVHASVPCNPVIDVDKTIRVEASGVTAKGKVRHVRHVLDVDGGLAISEYVLAISAIAGVGVTHPADTIVAPDGSEDGTSATPLGPTEIVWNGELGGDQQITISFPGVVEAERAKASPAFTADYRAAISEDVFEVTL